MGATATIVIAGLPRTPWWGTGTPAYEDNWMMREGVVPERARIVCQHGECVRTLDGRVELVQLPFPAELDHSDDTSHDFVFVRDSFIAHGRGDVILSNFARSERRRETDAIATHLLRRGYRVSRLAPDEHVEGGDLHFVRGDRLLFAGLGRNNAAGVAAVAARLRADHVCIIETDAFHIDTVFSPVLAAEGRLCAGLIASELVANLPRVRAEFEARALPLLQIEAADAIGKPGAPGSLAVNCLALPGLLVGSARFETPGVEETLARLGIEHVICDVSEFLASGGAIHCLTNEL